MAGRRAASHHGAMSPMETTVRALLAPGKGILAADESTGTIEKRFRAHDIPSTPVTRRAYREMLVTAPGLQESISGVILYDETLRQMAADGTPLVELVRRQGLVAGIKVDLGAKPLAGFPGEKCTIGLDGLRERLAEYAELGAAFTKWRAVLSVSATLPTRGALEANAHALARFAALSQEAGLVPIVEPEVLMDDDCPLERHETVTTEALRCVFAALAAQRVELETMLLKPNMVLAGSGRAPSPAREDCTTATLRTLRRTVPVAVPGIVFLSGGQGEVEATERLDALNRAGGVPWALSFSYGRALQATALGLWRGDPERTGAAQQALVHRARCNRLARAGRYTPDAEATQN